MRTRVYLLGLFTFTIAGARGPERIPWMSVAASNGPVERRFDLGDVPINRSLVLNRLAIELPAAITEAECRLTSGRRTTWFRVPDTEVPARVVAGPAKVSLSSMTLPTTVGRARVEPGHLVVFPR